MSPYFFEVSMFNDPMVTIMFMQLFCFFGMLIMFLYVVRAVSALGNTLRESTRQQQSMLADMERQLMDNTFLLRRHVAPAESEQPRLAPVVDNDIRSLLDAVGGLQANTFTKEEPGYPLTAQQEAEQQRPTLEVSLPDLGFAPAGTVQNRKQAPAPGLDIRLDR